MEDSSGIKRTWNPGELAWVRSKRGIPLTVWIHHITDCGRYALISYSRKEAKKHPVLVSGLRKPEERK